MLSYVNIANSEPKHKSADLDLATQNWILRLPLGRRKRSRLRCARPRVEAQKSQLYE
jgi:hypothetical protein